MDITIKTNGKPRNLLCWFDLSEKERSEFDYVKEEDRHYPQWFRYRGLVHYLGNFTRVSVDVMRYWDGVEHDTMFSGTCVRYTKDCEQVVVGRFYS